MAAAVAVGVWPRLGVSFGSTRCSFLLL